MVNTETRVCFTWVQSRTGELHVRNYDLDGARLTLTTERSNDPVTGKKTVHPLTWKK